MFTKIFIEIQKSIFFEISFLFIKYELNFYKYNVSCKFSYLNCSKLECFLTSRYTQKNPARNNQKMLCLTTSPLLQVVVGLKSWISTQKRVTYNLFSSCHTRPDRVSSICLFPPVCHKSWIPAFAGMTFFCHTAPNTKLTTHIVMLESNSESGIHNLKPRKRFATHATAILRITYAEYGRKV